MAELLIRLTVRLPDLAAGNLLDCRDGGPWGRMEDPLVWAGQSAEPWPSLGTLAIVSVPGVSAAEIRERAGEDLLTWRIDMNLCPAEVVTTLQNEGRAALADLSAVVSRATGEPI